METLGSTLSRLQRLERTVGHGNFHLLGFDEARKVAGAYASVGAFPKAEVTFLDRVFHCDGSAYGFFGEKPLKRLTDRIPLNHIRKMRGTGSYLYRGRPTEIYRRIRKEVGEEAVITSGVRSVIKQFKLFLAKAWENDGNFSLASRSLAPPGYSYHGVGDFDIGQKGWGVSNFTERFTKSEVYRKLEDGGFVRLRYRRFNKLGVRFEPWHIQVN
jgi:hypothetical protein